MENKTIDPEVMDKLEKEVERIGTMYFVWQSREPTTQKHIDFFVSNDCTLEDLGKMLEYMKAGIAHKIKHLQENI